MFKKKYRFSFDFQEMTPKPILKCNITKFRLTNCFI